MCPSLMAESRQIASNGSKALTMWAWKSPARFVLAVPGSFSCPHPLGANAFAPALLAQGDCFNAGFGVMQLDQGSDFPLPFRRNIHQHQQGSFVDVVLVFLYYDVLNRHSDQGAGPDPEQDAKGGQGHNGEPNAEGLVHRQKNSRHNAGNCANDCTVE